MLSFLIIFLLCSLINRFVDVIALFKEKTTYTSEFDAGWLWAVYGLFQFLMLAANLLILLYLIVPFKK
jgi:hypothetical protein